jgi:hypothetical protein
MSEDMQLKFWQWWDLDEAICRNERMRDKLAEELMPPDDDQLDEQLEETLMNLIEAPIKMLNTFFNLPHIPTFDEWFKDDQKRQQLKKPKEEDIIDSQDHQNDEVS